MLDARFSRFAEAEFEDAIGVYNAQRDGRGDRFRDAVRATVTLLRNHPKIGTPYRGVYRKRLVPNFPYLIFYAEYPDYIWIQSVYHASQQPDSWLDRELPPTDDTTA